MMDVTGLGELLIDFTPAGKSKQGSRLFAQNPGGAPANVLAAAARLGLKTAFIGKVGRDSFGSFLTEVLKSLNIDTRGLIATDEAQTTLAFVHLDETGDRSFSFYRKPGADRMLRMNEVDSGLIRQSRVFHFGSVSMTHDPSRSATLEAAYRARAKGVLVSYDPNLRPLLWDDLITAREVMLEGLHLAHILKLSQEEMHFLTGIQNLQEGTQYLWDKHRTPLIAVTLGPQGCYYRRGGDVGRMAAYEVDTVDTTGAGDAFMGALLYQVLKSEKNLQDLTAEELEQAFDFANAAGSLATTRLGAIPAMPALEEVEALMAAERKLSND